MKALAFILLLCPLIAAEPVWKQDGNRTVELSGEQGTIVRFVLDAAPRDPHFDILATADGRNTVWVSPPDHIWHYGLWFSWKKINGVNFWETDRELQQKGRNVILEPMIQSEPDGSTATITYRERSHPDPNGPAVLEDKVEIRITRPADETGPMVEWSMVTTALEDVTLDRTPPPGQPGGRDWGGYGGFSWRGAKELEKVTYRDSEARRDHAIHRQSGHWVSIAGSIEDRPLGILILDHPDNPRHPTSWYITSRPDLPFWYANPALLQDEPLKLSKGQSIEYRYRILLANQPWTPKQSEEAAREFDS